jgi:hypothetical protein
MRHFTAQLFIKIVPINSVALVHEQTIPTVRLRLVGEVRANVLEFCLSGLEVRVPGYGSRGPVSDSRHYQIFREVVGLERGPLSLVSTTEKLLQRKSSGSGLETREYGRRDLLC